jgi:hypothetical protein
MLLLLQGAVLIYASTSGPHFALFKNRNPPTFPGIPDVSVWLGLQRGEMLIDTRIASVSVSPFKCDLSVALPFPFRVSLRAISRVLS